MEYVEIPLSDLLEISEYKNSIQKILSEFKSIKENDIEDFLHNKSVEMEKRAVSTTYLVYTNDLSKLVGYYALANKSLMIADKNFEKLNNKLKRKLLNAGHKNSNEYIVSSYLIGQIGKNYAIDVKDRIKGSDLLSLAYKKVQYAKNIINAKFVWLECEDNDKLVSFYENFGFVKINQFKSTNGLNIMIMKIKD